ncbi:MAG: DUF1295 domain-containing protein [Bowdeniella nasicola]|nr:DUF1295 domain-containing protein [Bowdeniella nasicola]
MTATRLIATVITVLLGGALALAGSAGGQRLGTLPLFALAVGVAFLIQWLAFVPAYLKQTERFFDLTGALTYIAVTVGILASARPADARAWLLAALIVAWAVRLGTFLAWRVHRFGGDRRFEDIKPSASRFFFTWTLQGLWVSVTASAAWVAITSTGRAPLGVFAWAGTTLWLVGFVLEVVADAQKTAFKSRSENAGRFIHTGLWSRSRHPNYAGEILLWVGIAVIAWPNLSGWGLIGLVSPVFVALLLTRVSGIPMLEAKADKTWGGQSAYEQYKAQTPLLIPAFGSRPQLEE